ncbi:hypothetical protein CROQUDRAFT_50048, partial [Cronartium quercuum f. sp. fusiforme G11]
KEKLYEAKGGAIEWYNRWDTSGIGLMIQSSNDEDNVKKKHALHQKYLTYQKHANQFHQQYLNSPIFWLPTYDKVKASSLDDSFWNLESLTHPSEPWAVDKGTQTRIQAYQTFQSCEKELWRIALEVHKMVHWSLAMKKKLGSLLTMSNMGVSYQTSTQVP